MKSAFSLRLFVSLAVACFMTTCLAPSCPGADVSHFITAKGADYAQTSAGAPVLSGALPWTFHNDVGSRLPGLVTNATLKFSNVTSNLASECDGWGLQAAYATSNALTTAFPNGNYTNTAWTLLDGVRSLILSVTNNQYPAGPAHVTNYTAAQAIDPTMPFKLGWDGFTGGTMSDLVWLQIFDQNYNEVFSTSLTGGSGALTGTSNSYTFSENSLPPGQTLSGILIFLRGTATSNNAAYPGVQVFAGYFRQTEFAMVTTGTPETTPPQFVWSAPWDGAAGVPVNSSIAFTFDEPMRPGQSIYWSVNLNSNKFNYTWLSDQRTLVCTYYTNLPANATISWTLNPAAAACGYFEDISGNGAFSDQSGSFNTGNTGTGVKDVTLYGCGKVQSFTQTNSAVPAMTNEIMFEAFLDLSATYTATNATVQPPAAAVRALLPDSYSGDNYYFSESFSNQAALDAAYASGNYVMTVQCVHDGSKTATNNLSGSYPNIPRVGNYAAAQAVNPALNFTLTWDAFIGGTTNDFIQLDIRDGFGDSVFRTPESPFLPGALHGNSNSVVIPAGTCTSGQTYQAELFFAKLVTLNSNSYPGVISLTFYARRTEFALHTTGSTQPLLSQPTRLSPSQFRFLLTGTAGQNYTLQANTSTALASNGWFQILVTNAPASTITITDPNATNNQRVYRALLGP